jgi:hypothetical protein
VQSAPANVITCGSTTVAVPGGPILAGQYSMPLALDTTGGSCTLALTIDSTATPDPYGLASPTIGPIAFTIGTPLAPTFAWSYTGTCADGACSSQVVALAYTGQTRLDGGDQWTITGTCEVAETSPAQVAEPAASPDGVFPATLICPSGQTPHIVVTWEYLGAPGAALASQSPTSGPPGSSTTTTSSPPTTTASTSSTSGPPTTGQVISSAAGRSRAPGRPIELAAAQVSLFRPASAASTDSRLPLVCVGGSCAVALFVMALGGVRRRVTRLKGTE